MTRLAFWQQLASPHQAALAREVAARLGPDGVMCFFDRPLDHSSLRLGWAGTEIDYGLAQIQYIGGDGRAAAARLLDHKDAVHVFSSLATDAGIRAAFREGVKRGCKVGLLSEGRDWRGWKGLLRWADSLRHERVWSPHVSFVLAIGSMGRRWYESCGYESARIFDFCYVVESPGGVASLLTPHAPYKVVFVGRLVPGKRVDLLLRAVARLRHLGVVLDVVGMGPMETELKALAGKLALQQSVTFRGGLGNVEVNGLLASADLLVLPSHWDGWGAVVNEALCNGARVVCSDYCGAADLIRSPRFGRVFREGSLDDLTRAIAEMIAEGRISGRDRDAIRKYSQSFAGPAAADYLIKAVEWATGRGGHRPEAPWRQFSVEDTEDAVG